MSDIQKIVNAASALGDQAMALHRQAHVLMAGWHSIDRDGMQYLLPTLSHLSHTLKVFSFYVPELSGKKVEEIEMWENRTGYEEIAAAGWDRDQLCEATEQWYHYVKELRKSVNEVLTILAKVAKPPLSLRFLSSAIASDLYFFAVQYKRANETSLEPWLK